MVRIFRDKQSGEYVVQTTCCDMASFIADLSDAIAGLKGEGADILGVFQNAMPIAFKLSGYKADNVQEQRTLLCGFASPAACDLLVTVGK